MSIVKQAADFLKELDAEAPATRTCMERFDFAFAGFKPHPTSMAMGYLVQLVADIPHWITVIIEKGEIDFATYQPTKPVTSEELLARFDENMRGAQQALSNLSEEDLRKPFYVKTNGETLYSTSKEENIAQTLNHWVHHRGQLTVYMRMKEIPVPSIYGPSADERGF